MIIVGKKTVYVTSDGLEHSSMEMAEQHIANEKLRLDLQDSMSMFEGPQDILNFFSGRRQQVRAWLDSCDAMEKESMK